MLRCTLIFFLISSYGRSLGGPVKKPSSNGTILIGNLLNDLSQKCKNEFVLGQIESKKAMCDVEMNYHDVPMQCLMFFDANRVLCNFTGEDLATDFTAKVNEMQNVTTFCSEAAHFTLPAAPYQKMISFVFQSDVACTKVCTDEDIRTGHTNFFCKYYKWALSKFDPVPSLTNNLVSPTGKPADSRGSAVAEETNDINTIHANQGGDAQPKPDLDKPSDTNDDPHEHASEVPKPESPAAPLSSIQSQDGAKLLSDAENTTKKTTQSPSRLVSEIAADLEYQPNPDGEPIVSGTNEVPAAAGGQNNIAVNQPETQQQRAHLDNDDDAVVDAEDDNGRDDNIDDGGDDGADPNVRYEQEPKISEKHTETQSMFGDGSQREYPGGFAEDDDHFFPFFLTAVIVVVVLYILYHNKNKVGKLIFGLIVEGRQSGRRRNSRGHAYRRLDTLEQAMSTNTAAPPSKIIY